jgi:hypothetical protein
MNPIECPREPELMEVVTCGRWPEHCPAELRDHVTRCAICADAVEVAIALHEDYDAAFVQAKVPPPGLVWWRAELRARQEAMRTVSRPMTLVQAFGGACAVGVVLAALSPLWPLFKNWLSLPDLPQVNLPIAPDISAFSPLLIQWGSPLLLAIALGFLIVVPVAMYLVLSRE